MAFFAWVRQRLFLLVLLVILFAGGGFVISQDEASQFQPMESYKLLSPLKAVQKNEIDQVLQAYLGTSFFGVNLNRLQADLTRLDWVYKAEVKRQWPNRFLIKIEEQEPVVLWKQNGLLNKLGDIFYPKDLQPFQNLVKLEGEAQRSRFLLQKLSEFQTVFSNMSWHIKKLTEQADGVWKIEFVKAPTVLIDQEVWQEKLQRFLVAYPKVKQATRKIATQIDLRYSNGFVIKQNKPSLPEGNPS